MLFIGDESEEVGYMSYDSHSPDGYYSWITARLGGDTFSEDIRRCNVNTAAEFIASAIIVKINTKGHFTCGGFNSVNYYEIITQ